MDNFLGGPANFDALHIDGVWNWPTWHHVILSLVGRIDNLHEIKHSNDCFFVTLFPLQLEEDGSFRVGNNYPRLRVRPGHVERQADSGPHKFTVSKIVERNAGQFMALLTRGTIPSEGAQASHRCENLPQLCVNPNHVIWESAIINQSRDSCDDSTAIYCPYPVKCPFTDHLGRSLPHRNALTNPPFTRVLGLSGPSERKHEERESKPSGTTTTTKTSSTNKTRKAKTTSSRRRGGCFVPCTINNLYI